MPSSTSERASHLATEISKVKRGTRRMTARRLLDHFGYAKRSAQNVTLIQDALSQVGLNCEPPLSHVSELDAALMISLASTSTLSSVPTSVEQAPPIKQRPTPSTMSSRDALQRASQATVVITLEDGHGSGFVADPSGLVVTARHVVGRNQNVRVGFQDGTEVEGRVLASHNALDYAILQVPPCKVAIAISDEEVFAGQTVFAIGAPKEATYAGTMTRGIISFVDHVVGGVPYLQVDALTMGGGSGGPLLSEDGHVVGINLWGDDSFAALNFFLPARFISGAIEGLREDLPDIDEHFYCIECGFLNGPDNWIPLTSWVCCGGCGTHIGETENQD